jgi:hypothetical protein
MTQEEAGRKLVPFGQYRGMTLEQVFQVPGGEAFLFGLLNERAAGFPLKQAIKVFLEGIELP